MRSLCRWFANTFLVLWLLALALLVIGTFGLFGQDRDPLSGIFLIPLGLPWNRFIDLAPEGAWHWLAAFAPGINVVLLRVICAKLVAKGTTP
jgi:hypothetical protein